jgi:hypothetical protein
MCRAVDLDDKLFFAANEVAKIWTDRLLADELESAESAISKSPPKLAFTLGLAVAQAPRAARFMQA